MSVEPAMATSWLDLENKRGLVLGAGGLGSGVVAGLAAVGATVVVGDLSEQAISRLLDSVNSPSVTGLRADVSTPDSARAAVTEATARLGRLDFFVHAIGRNDRRPVIDLHDDDWGQIIRLNLDSAWWTGQEAGRTMLQQGHGRIVFFSSVSGLLAHAHHAPYAASKGGVNQMMRVMAREWAPHNITVNAVAPGYIETELTTGYLAKPGVREDLVRLVPAGRLGVPSEVADVVTFLCSDRSSFVTGQVHYIDGGRTLV